MPPGFGTLSLLALVWVGISVLWAARLAYRHQGAAADDAVRLVLNIAGWALIIAGVLGVQVQVLVFLSPLGWLLTIAILMMAVGRYRTNERRALLQCVAVAAERGIPISQAARAFAMERSDELGLRALRLAELLESGMPLPAALAQTRTRLPTDALVAVRVGHETGALGSALSVIARYDDDADLLVRSMFEKCFYLAVVANILMMMLTFMMLRIVPVFAKMFQEFDIELPEVTQWCIVVSNVAAQYAILFLPLAMLVMGSLFLGFLYYVGLLPRDIPLLNRLGLRMDAAFVMRGLALAVRQRLPLPKMVWLLAGCYPKWSIRSRLTTATTAMNNGEHWCQALRRAGILRNYDAAVLNAAERSGNLEWALEEMADSSLRRLAYRLRLVIGIVFPLVLVAFGAVVALFVIGLFVPLVSMIQSLT